MKDRASISFKKFLEVLSEYNYQRPENMREGQGIMNILFKIWSEEYYRVCNTEYDCFYDDRIIDNTLDHLESVWKFKGKKKSKKIKKIIRDYTIWLSSYHIVTFNRQNINNVVKEYLENEM